MTGTTRSIARAGLAFATALSLAACRTPQAEARPEPAPAVRASTPAPASVLGPSDVVDVRVFGEADLSGTHRVGPAGDIDFPLCGKVRVSGRNAGEAADIVLPGCAFVERDATYTNNQGMVQAASRVIMPPGDAVEDWQILASIGTALGLSLPYSTSADVRAAIAQAMEGTVYASASQITFARPLAARSWLQASNPSERWKWDFMFQDLPPVKGHNVQMEGASTASVIPLKPVE